jgi:nucleotide-binding universal stress UspA family protein
MYKRILVPIDGSEPSTRALAAAAQLARISSGRLRLLQVFDALDDFPGFRTDANIHHAARDHAQGIVDEACELVRAVGVPVDTRLVASEGEDLGAIVARQARDWEADLVAVGTHGRRGTARAVLGSGAEQVIRSTPVPVLVVRGWPPARVWAG